jgi:hypothetical protein
MTIFPLIILKMSENVVLILMGLHTSPKCVLCDVALIFSLKVYLILITIVTALWKGAWA